MRAAGRQLARVCVEAASAAARDGHGHCYARCDVRVAPAAADVASSTGGHASFCSSSAPPAARSAGPKLATFGAKPATALALEFKTPKLWAEAVADAAPEMDLTCSIEALDTLACLLPCKLQREPAFRTEQLVRTVCARADSMDPPRLSRVVRLLGKLASASPEIAGILSSSRGWRWSPCGRSWGGWPPQTRQS